MTDRDSLATLPCEDPEEPCDADGRDAHRWCNNCIARGAIARAGVRLAAPEAPSLDANTLGRAIVEHRTKFWVNEPCVANCATDIAAEYEALAAKLRKEQG